MPQMGKIGRMLNPGRIFDYRDVPGLEALYKRGVGITLNGREVSQWDDQSGNGNHLKQSTATNQPVNLAHDGENYLWLPNVNGNDAETPSTTALDVLGSIDLISNSAFDDWASGATQIVVSKELFNQSPVEFSAG